MDNPIIEQLTDWLERQWDATTHPTDDEHPEERAYRNGMGYAYYKVLTHILDMQKEDKHAAE